MRVRSLLLVLATCSAVSACKVEHDQDSFRRAAEKAYIEAHPGWSIVRREGSNTVFVRGDQLDTLTVGAMFEEYKKSNQSGSDWFDAWIEVQEKESKARRRSLDQAKDAVIPIIKSGSWIRVQDLGAIGPKDLQDRIRPWRKDVANEVVVLLGIPEERLGFRFASIEEVRTSAEKDEVWLERAVANLRKSVGTSTGAELRGAEDRLLVYDLSGYDNISGLILDTRFRLSMLDKFGKEELGAAAPIRNVLIIFDSNEFVAVKPVRARAHQLYDTQNHPSFRGLMRFDRSALSILEPGSPEKRKAVE